MPAVRKIISGGQTGVDRTALDFALENNIETGGFVPKGRIAEDGRIPDKYPNLIETATADPAERTELNVKTADATLILSQGPLPGGSKLTKELAERYGKPVLHIDLSSLPLAQAMTKTKDWLNSIGHGILNIAGPRASEDGEIYAKTKHFLKSL